MKTINLDELKLIQLDIVQAFHDFCVEYKIKYSLACGTLLGAIRHNGYIPWDDDIDVYMERNDYNKFISLFPQLYKNIYKLSCLENNKEWNMPYGKLYDNRTIMIEEADNKQTIGVNIDIYPVDSVPDNPKIWQKYNRLRVFIRDISICKTLKLRKGRTVYKNLVVMLSKLFLFFIDARTLSLILSKYAQRFNGKDSAHRLFENVQGIFQKQPFDKSDFKDVVLHKFEDRELYVMKGYDHCLKCGFGDYMKLPPIEKRISHHSFKAYWKDNV